MRLCRPSANRSGLACLACPFTRLACKLVQDGDGIAEGMPSMSARAAVPSFDCTRFMFHTTDVDRLRDSREDLSKPHSIDTLSLLLNAVVRMWRVTFCELARSLFCMGSTDLKKPEAAPQCTVLCRVV